MLQIILDEHINEIEDLFLLHLKLAFHWKNHNPAFNMQNMIILVDLITNYSQDANRLLDKAKHNMLKYSYPHFNQWVEQTLRDIAQIIINTRKEQNVSRPRSFSSYCQKEH